MARSSIFGLALSLIGFLLAMILNLPPGPLISVFCVISLILLPKNN